MSVERDSSAASGPGPSSPTGPVGAWLGVLLNDLRASVSARLDVAHVEVRLAANAMLHTASAAAVALLLALSSWAALCAALVVIATQSGVSWVAALFGACLLNAVLAACAARYALARRTGIGLPNTRRLFLSPAEDSAPAVNSGGGDAIVQPR